MRSLLQLSLRFVSLSALTALVFFGGLVARFTQSDPQEQEKLAKDFGLNTAHADFPSTNTSAEGVGAGGGEGDACESDSPEGAGDSESPC